MYMTNKLKLLISFVLAVLVFLLPEKVWSADDSYDLIERVYGSRVTYNPGSMAAHYKDGFTLSTNPQKPCVQNPLNQSVLIYDQIFTEETVLMRINPGRDGREQIHDTTTWPYSIHAHLRLEFGNQACGGSGVIVGPHHLLTCGHCVYDFQKKILFDNISVYPALNGVVAPFFAKATKAYMFKTWRDSGNQQFDMALLLLDQPIGNYVGWGGLLSTADKDLEQESVNITGYPGDKGFKQMWSMSHTIKTVMPEQFDYIIDTHGGQSGSAVWINKWGMPMIVGVHTNGVHPNRISETDAANSGVRLSVEKFKKLFEIISGTYTINDVNDSGLGNPLSLRRAISLAPQGHEEIYQRFLRGVLIYRPQPGTDIGRIDLPIAALANPLESTFDLSCCGDSGMHLSISTGYRKRKKAENTGKVEIWITPRFLIEKEIATTASHFKPIINYWKQNASVGLFWMWGGWDDLTWYDYVINQSVDEISNDNLYEKWHRSYTTSPIRPNFRNIIGYHNEEAGTYGSPHSKGAYFFCELKD
jgi:V8-like Glu-specific endopeptidase